MIKNGGKTLRIRKESFGCSIYDSSQIYAEGNHVIYDFLKGISEAKGIKVIINDIAKKYNVESQKLAEDFIDFFQQAKELGWFEDKYTEFRRLFFEKR